MTGGTPRVLEVIYSFRVGGSELVGVELAGQLAAAGVKVYCAALDPSPGPLIARCADLGIEVVDLKIPQRNVLGRNGVSIGLARRLRSLRLDALHVQHFIALNKLGIPARIARIPRTVVTEHSVLDVSSTRAVRFRVRLNWRLADTIAVVHPGIRDYLCRSLRVPERRVEVVPLGIELARFHRTDRSTRREALGLGAEMAFIFVGRLATVKNVPGLVSAFLAVQTQGGPPARLIVLGDGEERAAVDALVATHPLGRRVSVVGEQADVRSYLAAADVFVLNSHSEGTPRALLEAMAMGLPAISPAVGDIPQIIRGRGWLTEPGKQASLEDALRACLENPAQVEQAGRTCQEYVRENFDAHRSAERYRHLLVQ